MDGATIQGKVYYGYKQAALRVGLPFNHFRPPPGTPSIAPSSQIGSVLAAMAVGTATNFNFARPALETDYQFQCLADGTLLQVGDVLQNPTSLLNFFIGEMAPLMPVVAVRCNTMLTVRRRTPAAQVPGVNPYSGASFTEEITTLDGLVACVMLASAGKATRSGGLPGDAPGPMKYSIALSPLVDETMIAIDDAVLDSAGRRFIVAGYEKTPVSFVLEGVHMLA
jgi:hypothetical protein